MPRLLKKLLLAAVAVVLLIPALWVLVSFTAKPLYPDPEQVPGATGVARAAVLAEEARRIVRAEVAARNLPGLSVAVGQGGELVWAEGFGYADLKSRTPVTPTHAFRIGTATAALTAAAVELLVKDGKLRLADTIQTYVPSYPVKKRPVTLRALLEQTAGLPAEGDLFTKHCATATDAVQQFAQLELATTHSDSAYNWILVSAAIETAAGVPFPRFLKERVLDPLQMQETTWEVAAPNTDDNFPPANLIRELIYDPRAQLSVSAAKAVDDVTPYATRFASDPKRGLHLMRPLDHSCYAGASGLLSTPADLVRFAIATKTRDVNGQSMGGIVASLLSRPEKGPVVAVVANVPHSGADAVAQKIAEVFARR